MANGVIIIVQEDTVIWCLKWNHQDCFDAAFYKDKTLLTLQFTTDHTQTMQAKLYLTLQSFGICGWRCVPVISKFEHIGVREKGLGPIAI